MRIATIKLQNGLEGQLDYANKDDLTPNNKAINAHFEKVQFKMFDEIEDLVMILVIEEAFQFSG